MGRLRPSLSSYLQWQQCSIGQKFGEGGNTLFECSGQANKYTWQEANEVVNSLNSEKGYAGYKDWRIPRIEELRTLVYCSSGSPSFWNDTGKWDFNYGMDCTGHYISPTIISDAFPQASLEHYWSSTSDNFSDDDRAWVVTFVDGNNHVFLKTDKCCSVRLVRGG